ncbi:MAG: urate oxidase [Actinomycetota bacterium]|nr:urate oxidase [Actinomycetota bacterium]
MEQVELGHNRYGKSGVRLVKVMRQGNLHHLADLTVEVLFEGDFGEVHLWGNNRRVLPTDTMRNTIYALARKQPLGEIESFGSALADHFLQDNPALERVEIGLTEHPWSRIEVAGRPHPHAFLASGSERRTARVTATRKGVLVEGGIEGLAVFKTTGSSFSGFRTDAFTTLPEAEDRLLSTVVSASWLYRRAKVPLGSWEQVRRLLLEAFATHEESRSLQHTAYLMGRAVLTAQDEVASIRLSLPNKHHLLLDLSPFGLDNPDEVFVATDRPYGLIEVTVRRPGDHAPRSSERSEHVAPPG